jgi:hypothetical protein
VFTGENVDMTLFTDISKMRIDFSGLWISSEVEDKYNDLDNFKTLNYDSSSNIRIDSYGMTYIVR